VNKSQAEICDQCDQCGLFRNVRKRVIVRGNLPCDILFIGQAPGKSEDVTGLPFSGPSGVLLNKALEITRINQLSYAITNCVQCRPCNEFDGPNRPPTNFEIECCRGLVDAVIEEANPRTIIFLGAEAKQAYSPRFPHAYSLVHPAYILRQGGQPTPLFRRFVAELREIKNAV